MRAQTRPRPARGATGRRPRGVPAPPPRRRSLRAVAGWAALALAIAAALTVHLVTRDRPHGVTHAPNDEQARLAAALLAQHPTTAMEAPGQLPVGRSAAALARLLPRLAPEHVIASRGRATLLGAAYPDRGRYSGRFVRANSASAGFARLPLPPWYQTMQPGADEFAPLAAGDVNNDGWPDVAVGSPWGDFLYLNLGGRYALERIDEPAMRSWRITYTAIIDLDGDGWRDLFLCTWHQGCHVLWNQHGSFGAAAETTLPGAPEAAHAAAFGDLNRDGRVDIVTGASTELEWNFSPQTDVLYQWTNNGDRTFRREALAGPRGETLTLLIADLNNDGWPDLWAGNDFDEPDVVFLNQHGHLVQTNSGLLPHTTTSSMSLDTGDINNDGRPEAYEGAIAFGGVSAADLQASRQPPGASCRASIRDLAELNDCLALGEFQTAVVRSRDMTGVGECQHFTDAIRIRDCVTSGYLWNEAFSTLPQHGATRSAILQECSLFPAALVEMRDTCTQARRDPLDYAQAEKQYRDARPQLRNTNLLFTPQARDYTDTTRVAGVGFGGWTWNAKFADLDNDGWQDLWLTQGTRLRFDNSSNIFYRNLGSEQFSQDERNAGLEDHVPTGGSVFVDVNLDGRTDLVTYPFDLTPALWDNRLARRPGLEISLRDETTANPDGIGARVEVRNAAGKLQIRDIKASGGYDSADLPLAEFGLGSWRAVTSVTVTWPDGTQQSISGVRLHGGRYTFERRRV
jgi:hypothetical protein